LELMGGKLHAHRAVKIIETKEKDVVANVLSTITALDQPWQRMIIYVQRPQHAAKICSTLKEYDVTLLTGTMRF
jgi:hypothetical protein